MIVDLLAVRATDSRSENVREDRIGGWHQTPDMSPSSSSFHEHPPMALKVLDAIAQTEFLESRLEPSDCRVRIMTPARSARRPLS